MVWLDFGHPDIIKTIILIHYIDLEQISRMYQGLLRLTYARK